MLAVEPGCGDGGDEKLRPVGIRAGICHGYGEWPIVAQVTNDFILELATPYRLAASAVAERIAGLP
jgi:hypothetical protein